MLSIFTAGIAFAVAYAAFREGLFTSICLFINIFLAGLAAFNFFELAAVSLESTFRGTFLSGYEDFLALTLIFALALILLRTITNQIAPRFIDYRAQAQYWGAGAVGLIAGYVLAGFLVCTLQTLPWHENFLGFEPRSENEAPVRQFLPPDRVWLALMRYAGANNLAWKTDDASAATRYDRYHTFDPGASFELRYLRHRRHGEGRPPLPYQGEFDEELKRK